ncbi:MAG TPA: PQQ-binding-like beta-propeller repeat protein [Flavobacteriaceae bacterium]|nr:PQQ-binding-like beta-propeller repeat protein [Flavobacteriaceae bacterium]
MKMQYKLLKNTLCVAFVLSAAWGMAQKAETPDGTYELGATINEMTLTQGGILVVATNEGLAGIDPKKSTATFTFNNFGKLKPEETEFIPNSPYIVVSQGTDSKFSGIGKTKRAVIDYVTGTVLFNSEEDNWKQIYTCNVALPQNKVIVSGLQKSDQKFESQVPKVAVYDLVSGKQDYSFFLDKPGRVGAVKDFSVTGTPMLLKSSILIPTAQGILAMTHSGDELWRNKIKGVNWMVADDTEKEIYAFEATSNGKNTRIHKIGSNGAELWQDDRKVKGSVSNFQILPQGLAVVSDVAPSGGSGLGKLTAAKAQSHIAFLSAGSGEDLWEKAPKTNGYVQHFYIMDDGILFGIQEGGINKIAFDGKTLFKKPLKTGENIMIMAHTPQGLIYITGEDTNIVNLETGEQVWSKPLKYKKASSVASTYDSKNDRYLIAADGKIMAIAAETGEVSDLAKCDFGEKEDPNHMEIRDTGIYLSADQNMTLLGFDGSETYHVYHKSPGRSTFGKVVGGLTAVASTAMAVSMSARAGANRSAYGSVNDLSTYNDYGKEAKRAADMFSGIASASFDYLSTRFKATSATENAQFILTKLSDGVGLVKVNKDTGATEKEIVLKDKKPEYEVDEFGGYLFYKATNSSIYVYDLKE